MTFLSCGRRASTATLILAGHSCVVCTLLGFVVLPASVANASGGDTLRGEEDVPYKYRGYLATITYFEALAQKYPDIVSVWTAQEEFPEILPSHEAMWGRCEGVPCQTLVVRIANKKTLTDTTPEVFFSGALHGDERVGPLVVTELAGFLCRQYEAGHEEVRRLVDGRATWITPMTNAHGYASNRREENGMDPNRDFGYLQSPSACMRTQTARTVNELFRRHLFQFEITFHGGMRALTYEWGSRNHVRKSRQSRQVPRAQLSTESPDDRAFTAVGEVMQKVAGKAHANRWFYPLGRITDIVYPVDGGLEDWSYAAGWESSPSPITVCKPTTYGGYAKDRTVYEPGSVATLVYLAEMDDRKTPLESTLGRTIEVYDKRLGSQAAHVARNMRMCLKALEFARPELVMKPPVTWPESVNPNASRLELEFTGFGCLTLTTAKLLLVPQSHVSDCLSLRAPRNQTWTAAERQEALEKSIVIAELPKAAPCRGLTIWEEPQGESTVRLGGAVPAKTTGDFCVAIAAEFDQDWSHQSQPDPPMPPRAHATRLRLEDHYVAKASDGPMRIDEYRVKLFGLNAAPLHVELPPVAAIETSASGRLPLAVTNVVALSALPSKEAPNRAVAAAASSRSAVLLDESAQRKPLWRTGVLCILVGLAVVGFATQAYKFAMQPKSFQPHWPTTPGQTPAGSPKRGEELPPGVTEEEVEPLGASQRPATP